MNRRGFLKLLAGAALAPVADKIIVQVPACYGAHFTRGSDFISGVEAEMIRAYETLERRMLAGMEQPDRMVMHPDTFTAFNEILKETYQKNIMDLVYKENPFVKILQGEGLA